MNKIAALVLMFLMVSGSSLWAQTQPPADEAVTMEAEKVDVPKSEPAEPQAPPKDEEVVLDAQKVDPKTVAQSSAQAPQMPQAPQSKKKAKLPIFLQPFEFVASSIVHAVCFWDKGD